MKKWLFLFVLVAVGATAGGAWYWQAHGAQRPHFRIQAVERGPFLAAVGANGVVQPIDPVDVGAQVAGRIERLGTDPRTQAALDQTVPLDALARLLAPAIPVWSATVPHKSIDYNTPIEPGTVLAQIDPAPYQNKLDYALVCLHEANAIVAQAQVKVNQTDVEMRRAKEMRQRGAIAPLEYDQARYAFDAAQADLLRARAGIGKAEVAVTEARTNLDYCTIRSTVKGSIIARRVTVGQTVVSSLAAPSLFLLGKDLRKMQIAVSVNEADIAGVHTGQEVRFTVEKWRDEVFVGRVAEDQPRKDASMAMNVVTYIVMVDFDNSDLRIDPYGTATVKFVLDQKPNTLLIPNTALRYRPQPEHVLPTERDTYVQSIHKRRPSPLERGPSEKEAAERTLWVQDGDFVRPVPVRVGLSDGTHTELLAGALLESAAVVVGEEAHGEAGAGNNPFAPTNMYGGGKKK